MDAVQGSIFDLLENVGRRERDANDLRQIDAEIRSALIRDQRESGLSRDQVVDGMRDLGADITIHTYNNFLNESHKHRFPLTWVIHHVLVTGERSVLERISEVVGCRIQDSDAAVFEDLGRIHQLKAKLRHLEKDLVKRVKPLSEK